MNQQQKKAVVDFLLATEELKTLKEILTHLENKGLKDDLTEDALYRAISGDLGAHKTFHSKWHVGKTFFGLMPAKREALTFPF